MLLWYGCGWSNGRIPMVVVAMVRVVTYDGSVMKAGVTGRVGSVGAAAAAAHFHSY